MMIHLNITPELEFSFQALIEVNHSGVLKLKLLIEEHKRTLYVLLSVTINQMPDG